MMSNPNLKHHLWRFVRPLHSPFTKAARKRLGRDYANHPEMELPAAYEAVQLEAERRLHRYLHCDADEVKQIVIVGANEGSEIPRLRKSYPNSHFLCFEPSPKWFSVLSHNFRDADFVENREIALSDAVGVATFYELPLAGNGSLLRPNRARWSKFTQVENNEVTSFSVSVSTLDKEAETRDKIDLLWIDVQGAEARVIHGASKTLERVRAVFLEVALVGSPYDGVTLFPQLDSSLQKFGFSCVGLGLDPTNYGGNGLWMKNIGASGIFVA